MMRYVHAVLVLLSPFGSREVLCVQCWLPCPFAYRLLISRLLTSSLTPWGVESEPYARGGFVPFRFKALSRISKDTKLVARQLL